MFKKSDTSIRVGDTLVNKRDSTHYQIISIFVIDVKHIGHDIERETYIEYIALKGEKGSVGAEPLKEFLKNIIDNPDIERLLEKVL